MAELIVTKGLPGSGKSTWAREQVAGYESADAVILVSRDDIRAMIRPGEWPYGDSGWEDRCTSVQFDVIRGQLAEGVSVIVHDTNLRPGDVDRFRTLAKRSGVQLHVIDFSWVALETCLERDAARPNPVGADVIRSMHERYLAGGESA